MAKLRPALAMSAIAALVAIAAGDAVAGHRHDHVVGHAADNGHTAHRASGSVMPMEDGAHQAAAGHVAATPGLAGGAHAGHAMPDMQEMGAMSSNVHEVHLATTQQLLAHKTTIYALLVALNIDRERSRASLLEAREQFGEVQAGLRDGDAQRGLDGTDNAALRVTIQEVDIHWSRYDAVIRQILEQPTVTVGHVTMLTAADAELHRSLRTMAEAAERYSYGGRGHSILLPTVRHAQRLSAMLQQLVADYLLVAYGHDAAASDQALRRTAAEFDMVLDALTHGDDQLRVLGAPTPEIRAQYSRVRSQWHECWAAIEAMSVHRSTDSGMIGDVMAQVERVAAEVEAAVELYHHL